MAEKDTKRKDESSSREQKREEDLDWVDYSKKEVRELIVSLAKKGKIPTEIGRELRDRYGIPSVQKILGKSITDVLKQEDLEPEIPSDLFNLMQDAVETREHLEDNPKDTQARRGLNMIESKIKKIIKYYKEKDKLPEDWRYSPEKARLMTK